MRKEKIITHKKVCPEGHTFFKSSDCPVCPVCEKKRKPKEKWPAALSAPARRALENQNIKTVKQLSLYSEKEILQLHGIGPSSIPKLRLALKSNGLTFKKSGT